MVLVSKEIFGEINGIEINKYKIINDNKFQISIINYGAIITEIITKNKKGKFVNVVLGHDSFEKYKINDAYIGAIIGRTAGRTAKGKFKIGKESYTLNINNGNNSLHGGNEGFDKKIFDVEIIENGLLLKYISPDMEEGYPGTLNVTIKYTLDENNVFTMEYHAISDKDTYVNLTNHSYFNLSGQEIINNKNSSFQENGEKQLLKINADTFLELDSDMLGKFKKNVDGTIFDFREYKVIEDGLIEGDDQFQITNGYDHPFILDKQLNNFGVNASLYSKKSGIKMDIITNQESLIFYSGNFLEFANEIVEGEPNENYIGIALESQAIPNKINSLDLKESENQVLKKGEIYFSKTLLKFSIQDKI